MNGKVAQKICPIIKGHLQRYQEETISLYRKNRIFLSKKVLMSGKFWGVLFCFAFKENINSSYKERQQSKGIKALLQHLK